MRTRLVIFLMLILSFAQPQGARAQDSTARVIIFGAYTEAIELKRGNA